MLIWGMDSDYPRLISAAWVFNPIHGARADRLQKKLEEEVHDVLNRDGLHSPMIAPEHGAFWRQGHRMVEAMAWIYRQGVERISPPNPLTKCVQAAWIWEQEGGAIIPKDGGSVLPWPTMQDPVQDYPEILDGEASKVALSTFRSELEAVDSSPPWVHWALEANLDMLRAELEQCAWSQEDVAHWWRLMEGLLASAGNHWDIHILDDQMRISRLPVSRMKPRDEVVRLLGAFLPLDDRRPSRLSALVRTPEKGGSPFTPHEVVSSVLRDWVTPARFWSLRRSLHWNDFRASTSPDLLWDFERLPRPVAHRTLDKFAKAFHLSPPPAGTSLPLVVQFYHAAPKWKGWGALLESLEGLDALTLEGRGVLASLRAEEMGQRISKDPAPSVSAPRPTPSRF